MQDIGLYLIAGILLLCIVSFLCTGRISENFYSNRDLKLGAYYRNKPYILLRNTPHYLLVDKPIHFIDDTTGHKYDTAILDNINSDKFAFSCWIKVTLQRFNHWRNIFRLGSDDSRYNLGVLLSPSHNYVGCHSKIDIRLKNMGSKKMCVQATPLAGWYHFALIGENNTLKYYINGKLVQTVELLDDINIGNMDQWITVGGDMTMSARGIAIAKMRWFENTITDDIIRLLIKEKPDD